MPKITALHSTKITLGLGGCAMPSGQAAAIRRQFAQFDEADKADVELARNPYSNTGYTNVIKVKNKYQARLQVAGDGKGGTRKRKQYSLPGLFDTPKEAAEYLAMAKAYGLYDICDEEGIPKKQNKQHKSRGTPPQPAATPPPMQMPMATTMAMPIASPLLHAPFVAATPLSLSPLAPPAWPLVHVYGM